MEDANIYIRNTLSGSRSGAKQKLSAKGSIERNKNSMQISHNIKAVTNQTGKMLANASSGSSSVSLSKMKKAGGTLGVALLVLGVADKVASFGINLREAKTGEQVWAHNSRTTLQTIMSVGTNYLMGTIQTELFTKKVISRQNYGLDYGRELYNVNNEGTKNKRI